MNSDWEKYTFDDFEGYSLSHYGILEESGRYPWGSGEHPFQRLGGLYGEYRRLKKEGLSDGEIAEKMEMTTAQLRAHNEYFNELKFRKNVAECVELAEKGVSRLDIAKKLGISASTVSNYLESSEKPRKQKIIETRKALKDALLDTQNKTGRAMIQVGDGTEARMGIKKDALRSAVITLQDEGFEVYNLQVKQGFGDNYTTYKVLCAPGISKGEALKNIGDVGIVNYRSEDGGLTLDKPQPPINIDSKRIDIRYADDPISGKDFDGVVEIRRGVPDLDMKDAHYAQVRIAVDGKYYIKGMAVYSDDLPDGVDIRVNSNKNRSVGMEGALKEQEKDKATGKVNTENPFGSSFKTSDEGLYTASTHYIDPKTGERKQSALNFVNDEGTWADWDRNLPSQFLAKQTPALARQQLNIDASIREREFEEINSLTNPVLKRTLLKDFGETCDSAAVHLKATALPRQQTHVILPSRSIKENEVYAPNYEDGEEVCLVRFPHEGIYQIPRLIVNNRNKEAQKMISNQARDAVCINPKTAEILSGADFDGDTVLVLPTKYHNIINMEPLEGLKDFDAKTQYATKPEERAKLGIWEKGSPRQNTMMGIASNLVTDMTIQGATADELARATRYAQTIIDTGKHHLNYKQCEIDNNILGLQRKYQLHVDPETGRERFGASTLLSRSTSKQEVTGRKSYYVIDPETGEKVYPVDTTTRPKHKPIKDKEGNIVGWDTKYELTKRYSTKGAETKDPYTLTTGGSKSYPGTEIEGVYAEYASRMKALANKARKEYINTQKTPKDPQAAKVYSKEVDHLMWQLNEVKKNAPLERKALSLAEADVRLARQSAYAKCETLSKDEVNKIRDRALKKARTIVGSKRNPISISDREWEAIQAGAVSSTAQEEIFKYCDGDRLKELAMPREKKKLSKPMLSTARSMLDRGYTWAEVADRFGVSVSTLSSNLNG